MLSTTRFRNSDISCRTRVLNYDVIVKTGGATNAVANIGSYYNITANATLFYLLLDSY